MAKSRNDSGHYIEGTDWYVIEMRPNIWACSNDRINDGMISVEIYKEDGAYGRKFYTDESWSAKTIGAVQTKYLEHHWICLEDALAWLISKQGYLWTSLAHRERVAPSRPHRNR